ncbi:pentapeptide repeat-containing protein, partial [bacterium]|nr:pentapeptide repeat-containing protein [bacterium]
DFATEYTETALTIFNGIKEKDASYVRTYGPLVSSIGIMIAGPAGVIGFLMALWRANSIHDDSRLAIRKYDADLYINAVEQLGSENQSVRMGATLVIQELGATSETYREIIIKVLCAHIRARRGKGAVKKDMSGEPIPEDVQMVLNAIFWLLKRHHGTPFPLDFKDTNLSGAKLEDVDLKDAVLAGAVLRDANLACAKLEKADLSGADLTKAILTKADLSEAILLKAVLIEINANGAIFRGAKLEGADVRQGNFVGADRTNCNWELTVNRTSIHLAGSSP